MTNSYIKTYTYDNGELQRVQVVTANSFDELCFFFPKDSPEAFGKIVNLYRNFIVPRCPWIFGKMLLFYVPEDMKAEIASVLGFGAEGYSAFRLCTFLKRYVQIKGTKIVCNDSRAKRLCDELVRRGFMETVCGKLPSVKLLPVGNSLGFLSENLPEAKVKVNSNFFIMDCFDVASPVDRIGTPIGLMVKDGVVLNPPLFEREAFLVFNDGRVEVRPFQLSELTFEFSGNGAESQGRVISVSNATIYERPETCKISKLQRGNFILISGCRVEAVYNRGGFSVPSSGFVLKVPKNADIRPGDTVTYKGLHDVKFGVQVGNSIMVNGIKTLRFTSKFYNIYRQFGKKAYPPSLYPLDYDKARAPRIALGADTAGKPFILWAEGPKKTGYVPGEQSCGASLSEMAAIAEDLGLYNAVNLDGGGSAQILIDNKRALEISDRNPADGSGAERAVPAGIFLRE